MIASEMNGILVIDKPSGPTSFDMIREVRALLGMRKIGHTGTLDPLATGVLPLCLGEATKIASFILESEKQYEAVVRLGKTTDTLDAQGKVLAEHPVPELTPALLETALARFRGTLQQTPPMYSAVKVKGKRLYELAREGREVERPSREVTVHELTLRDFSASEVALSVRCSKGFFVRVLASDLGEVLGCGAHLHALRRTRTGPFTQEQAISPDKLRKLIEEGGGPEAVRDRLISAEEALIELPALEIPEALVDKVLHGVPLEVAAVGQGGAGRVRVMAPSGKLLAVAEIDRGRLRYARVLGDRR